jgi:hypothetical protein
LVSNKCGLFSWDINPSAAYLTGLNLGAGSDGSAVETTNPAGDKALALMDGAGRTVRTVQFVDLNDLNSNIVTDLVYDNVVNNLLETKTIRYPAGLLGGIELARAQYSDGAGRTLQVVDEEARVSLAEYDANSNQIRAALDGLPPMGWFRLAPL